LSKFLGFFNQLINQEVTTGFYWALVYTTGERKNAMNSPEIDRKSPLYFMYKEVIHSLQV